MKSNYKKIGDYIRLVNDRNSDLSVKRLLGLTVNKEFIPSVANIVGTDMANYKVIKKGQFACSLMQVRRDKKIPVALQKDYKEAIISQAYPVFEIIDTNKLLPEYLMMWMSRSEFDREACFYAVGGVRGSLEWEDFCNMELPVPDIEKQKEIVAEYNTVVNRIKLNEELNKKLEETAQAIYKQWFVDFEFPFDFAQAKPNINGKPYKSSGGRMVWNDELGKDLPARYAQAGIPEGWEVERIENVIPVKDGTHDSPKPVQVGYPLVTSTHLMPYSVSLRDTYFISKEDFDDVNRRSNVDTYDILFSMIGTVGLISLVLKDEVLFAIKNVGLFKTSIKMELVGYLLFYLKSDLMKIYTKTCLLGSTQNYITLTELRNIPLLLPSNHVLDIFNKIIMPLIENLRDKSIEIESLNKLKDILLSKMAKV